MALLSAIGWSAAGVSTLAVGMLVSSPWVIVDVDDRDEGLHIVVPAPVALAHVVAPFLDEKEFPVELPPEAAGAEKMALAAIEELERVEDFDMVRVENARETVLIRKEGAALAIHVKNDREEVHVRAPLSAAKEILARYDPARGVVRVQDLLAAADRLPPGKLVDVEEENTHVQVWVW